MRVQKEQMNIRFTDGTEGNITLETMKGRVDAKAEYEGVRVYYYTEHVDKSWIVKRCNDGLCYDTVIIADKATRKEAIAEIILDVRKNQVRTAYTYTLEMDEGREFEVVATSEILAKKAVRFKCGVPVEKLHVKEITKTTDEKKQLKSKIGSYADFICEIFPTPENTIKTEEEEEAENEHFVKQMSESEPEYIGIEYMDARRFDNWKKYLLDRIYEKDTEHDEIYCIIAGDVKITGWFWDVKGAEHFHRLHGGKIYKVDSLLYYLYEYRDMYLGIINEFDTYGISIESQLIQKGYLHKGQKPPCIFDALQTYTYQYELDWILVNNHMMRYAEHMYQYCQMVFMDFANGKDCEKSLQAFCHNMWYLINSIVAKWTDAVIMKGSEEDDSGKSVNE